MARYQGGKLLLISLGCFAMSSKSAFSLSPGTLGDEFIAPLICLALLAAVFWDISEYNGSTSGSIRDIPLEIGASKPPRVAVFDSIRFLLIFYIGVGHFIRFATDNIFVLRFFSQINVVVGAFFLLSGYVAALTGTNFGKAGCKPGGTQSFFVRRSMGIYPPYFIVLCVFAPMFFWVDYTYNGVVSACVNGLLSLFLQQAWFPLHAEVWNAPTWFLSSLVFANLITPSALQVMGNMEKGQLRRLLCVLFVVCVVPKLAYSYDSEGFKTFEGMDKIKNPAFWNFSRFSPFFATIEVLIGAACCRWVMIDNVAIEIAKEKEVVEQDEPREDREIIDSLVTPVLGMLTLLVGRTCGWITLSDLVSKSAVFFPFFCVLLMRLHNYTIYKWYHLISNHHFLTREVPIIDRLTVLDRILFGFLESPAMVRLGEYSFAIYLVHGPIGQIFYKKLVATAVFGGVISQQYFGFYLLTVGLAAYLLQKVSSSSTVRSCQSAVTTWALNL